jgi:hypothetical protein
MRTQRFGAGWAFTLSPARVRDLGLVIGEEATVELAPEGPQRAEVVSADLSLSRRRDGRRGAPRHRRTPWPQ